jgi:hypothetical protein
MRVVIEKILIVFLLQGIHGDQGADVSGQVGTVEETATTTQGPIVNSVAGIVGYLISSLCGLHRCCGSASR